MLSMLMQEQIEQFEEETAALHSLCDTIEFSRDVAK